MNIRLDRDLLAEIASLPFPVRQWRAVYVHELARALGRWSEG